jgi:hypothetical protein
MPRDGRPLYPIAEVVDVAQREPSEAGRQRVGPVVVGEAERPLELDAEHGVSCMSARETHLSLDREPGRRGERFSELHGRACRSS